MSRGSYNHPYDDSDLNASTTSAPLGLVIDRTTRLYIKHIPLIALDRFGFHALYADFAAFGPVERYQLFTDHSGRFTGAGMVTFRNAADAKAAMRALHKATTFLFQTSAKKQQQQQQQQQKATGEDGAVVASPASVDELSSALQQQQEDEAVGDEEEDYELMQPITQPLHVTLAKEHGVVLVDQLRRQYRQHQLQQQQQQQQQVGVVLEAPATNAWASEEGGMALPVTASSPDGGLSGTAAPPPPALFAVSGSDADSWKHDRFNSNPLPPEAFSVGASGGRGGGRGRGRGGRGGFHNNHHHPGGRFQDGRRGPPRGAAPWELETVDQSFETYITNRDAMLKSESSTGLTTTTTAVADHVQHPPIAPPAAVGDE